MPTTVPQRSAAKPKVIAVSGGSGSGKTTLVGRLRAACGDDGILVIQLDHYYSDLSHLPKDERDRRNFDHPQAFDTDLLHQHLAALTAGQQVERPTYDFASHTREGQAVTLNPAPVIILDGILALHWGEIRALCDLSVYVDVDDDVRFIRRLRRDISERGRSVDGVIKQYLETVKVMHDTFVAPQKHVADIIISWMDYNSRAVDMLAGTAKSWLGRAP